MSKILVTGATGFVGKHLLPMLLQTDDVTVITRNRDRVTSKVRVIEADLSNFEDMQCIAAAVRNTDVLIHLAAAIPTQSRTSEEEEMIQQKQVKGCQNLLKILPINIGKMILASTLDVYGEPQGLPITEKHPTNPITKYGWAKLECEKMMHHFCKERAIPLNILRITQIYGHGEPPIKAIPLFIQAVATGNAPMIYGDGNDTRDYIEVTDVSRAILAALTTSTNGIFNIASGETITLKEVAEMIIQSSGKPLVIQYKEKRKPQIHFHFDVSKAKRELKFEATVPLSEGLTREYTAYVSSRQ